jgi:hypothetical protein
MNKQFMIKMMQAKQLEYEALKEILPESMVKRVEKLEGELVETAMELFVTMSKQTETNINSSKKDANNKVRKVTIE